MSKATGHFSSLKHSQTLSTFNFIARKATGTILIKVLKTSWGSYSRISLTASVEMKSPYAGRVKGIKGFEHIPPKNVKIQIKQRADVAMEWHGHQSPQEHVWECLLSQTSLCSFLFPSVAANSCIPKGSTEISQLSFSSMMKSKEKQNKTVPPPTHTLVWWKRYKTKAGYCWETFHPLKKFRHFTPLSEDTCNVLLQLLWKTTVFITTQGTPLSTWGTVRGISVTFHFWQTCFKSFVWLIFPLAGKQAWEPVMTSSELARLLGCFSLWFFVICLENQIFSALASTLSPTS